MRSMDLLLCQFLILLRCHAVLRWNLSLPKRSPILMQSWKLFAAFQAVNLRTTKPPQLHPQCLSKNQRAALAEIIDVLRAVCHAHRLPLALSWIPCYYTEGAGDEMTRVRVREGNTNSNEKCKSLRTVSDAEYLGWKSLKLHFRRKKTKAFR